MSIYLVDYENVGSLGINGVRLLSGNDRVYIFYGKLVKTIPFEACIDLVSSKADIHFIKTNKTAKNYLDFQLSTMLGYLVGKDADDEMIIVSKDLGFDSVVDFWEQMNVSVSRVKSFEAKLKKAQPKTTVQDEKPSKVQKTAVSTKSFTEEYRKKVRAAVKNTNISAASYTAIYKAIVESGDKKEFHNALVKIFSGNGSAMYKLVKNVYEEYRQNCN